MRSPAYLLVELRRFPDSPSVLDQSSMELMFAAKKTATNHGRSYPVP